MKIISLLQTVDCTWG